MVIVMTHSVITGNCSKCGAEYVKCNACGPYADGTSFCQCQCADDNCFGV